jgi:hypothetical protein
MADQQFIVEVRIITECQEQVDEAFIANWVTEQFEGISLKRRNFVLQFEGHSQQGISQSNDHC